MTQQQSTTSATLKKNGRKSKITTVSTNVEDSILERIRSSLEEAGQRTLAISELLQVPILRGERGVVTNRVVETRRKAREEDSKGEDDEEDTNGEPKDATSAPITLRPSSISTINQVKILKRDNLCRHLSSAAYVKVHEALKKLDNDKVGGDMKNTLVHLAQAEVHHPSTIEQKEEDESDEDEENTQGANPETASSPTTSVPILAPWEIPVTPAVPTVNKANSKKRKLKTDDESNKKVGGVVNELDWAVEHFFSDVASLKGRLSKKIHVQTPSQDDNDGQTSDTILIKSGDLPATTVQDIVIDDVNAYLSVPETVMPESILSRNGKPLGDDENGNMSYNEEVNIAALVSIVTKELNFTGEEQFGKYLDFNNIYSYYLNNLAPLIVNDTIRSYKAKARKNSTIYEFDMDKISQSLVNDNYNGKETIVNNAQTGSKQAKQQNGLAGLLSQIQSTSNNGAQSEEKKNEGTAKRETVKITTLSYLEFVRCISNPSELMKSHSNKNGVSIPPYVDIIQQVFSYLVDFLRRSYPLLDIKKILQDLETGFIRKIQFGDKKKSSSNNQTQSKNEESKPIDDPLYCEACKKQFSKQTVYDGHLQGKKHEKNVISMNNKKQKKSLKDNSKDIDRKNPNAIEITPELSQKLKSLPKTMKIEFKIQQLVELYTGATLKSTIERLERRMTLTAAEIEREDSEINEDLIRLLADQQELQSLMSKSSAGQQVKSAKFDPKSVRGKLIFANLLLSNPLLKKNKRRRMNKEEGELDDEDDIEGTIGDEAGNDDDGSYLLDDDDDEDGTSGRGTTNPMKLPLGWDGKPIPYWLYKLHGLSNEFHCEVCGNFVYRGRKAFEAHFIEARHVYGMKCLSIPNTKQFHGITKIEDVKNLWKKLSNNSGNTNTGSRPNSAHSGVLSMGNSNDMEEVEDENGNVYTRAEYERLKAEGAL